MDSVTDETFEDLVLDAESPVVVDFSAPAWCGPCQSLGRVLEDVISDYPELTFLEYDMDLGTKYSWDYLKGTIGSKGVPTVVLYADGKPAEKFIGSRTKSEAHEIFTEWVEKYISTE